MKMNLANSLTMKKERLKASLEALKPQDGTFFNVMTEEVGKLRELSTNSSGDVDIKKDSYLEDIETLIKSTTGINAVMHVIKENNEYAYMDLANIGSGYIFSAGMIHEYGKDAQEYIDDEGKHANKKLLKNLQKKYLEGEVDINNNRVTGDLTSLEIPIYLGHDIFTTKEAFTDQEVAAIICHELGHGFSGLETLRYQYNANLIMLEALNNLNKVNDVKLRKQYIVKACDELKVSNIGAEEIANDSNISASIKLINRVIDPKFALDGKPNFDYHNCEWSADQYVIRLGGGSVILGIRKKFNETGFEVYYKKSSLGHVMLFFKQLAVFVLYLFSSIGVVALTMLFVTGAAPAIVILGCLMALSFLWYKMYIHYIAGSGKSQSIFNYEDPNTLVRRIKQDLVNQLKETNDPELIKSILAQVDEVSKVYEKIDYKAHGLYNFVWKIMNFGTYEGSRKQKEMDYHSELEELVGNDLFVTGNKIKYNL